MRNHIYRRYCKEHIHKLLFAKDCVSNERIGKASEPASPFVDKQRVGRYVIAIDCVGIASASLKDDFLKCAISWNMA